MFKINIWKIQISIQNYIYYKINHDKYHNLNDKFISIKIFFKVYINLSIKFKVI